MALRREIETQAQDSEIIHYHFGPATIYLDDVQLVYDKILAAVTEKAQDSQGQRLRRKLRILRDDQAPSIVIKAGEAHAGSLSDLSEARPKELKEVYLIIESPEISVAFTRQDAGISVSSSVPNGQELAIGIRNYINKRRSLREAIRLWSPLGLGLVVVIFMLSVAAVVAGTLSKPWHYAVPILYASAFIFVIIAVSNTLGVYRSGAIRLIPRKESETRSLSSETRKQVIIALIGAFAGALIVGLTNLWAGVYVHH